MKGYELWSSNGTAVGTGLVKDIYTGNQGSSPTGLTARGSTVFFAAAETDGTATDVELWRSNGSPGGTSRVKDIAPGSSASGNPTNITNAGGAIFLSASNGSQGMEPWRSDGTPGGTKQVANIRSGAGSSDPDGFTKAGSVVYFSADDGSHGHELWKVTAGGAALVKDIAR